MKLKTIEDNCQRLIQFKKINFQLAGYIDGVSSPDLLLRKYGRLLDYCGAPSQGLSELYVPDDEMEEFVLYAKSVDKKAYARPMGYAVNDDNSLEDVGFPSYLRFKHLGYTWDVSSR